jgi:hypothetical protein
MPYAEQPFKKARQVVNYIGRYSHSIATCLPAKQALAAWQAG